MNKILLSTLALCMSVILFANLNNKKENYIKNENKVSSHEAITGFEGIGNFTGLNVTANTSNFSAMAAAPAGDVAGFSTYDLQTNRGVCRRVAISPVTNNWHFGWTMDLLYSDDPGPARGTGYNFYDVVTGSYQAAPTVKIEPIERTGWPNMGVTASGRVFSITHTLANGMNFCYKDDELPTTAWQETVVGTNVLDEDGVWARAAVDGDNIHVVISRQTSFNGIASGLNYIRSVDNGDTWTALGGLEYDYANSFGGMEPDSYQIDAENDVVVVAYGGVLSEIILYKSTDGGDNWGKSTIQSSSNPRVENKGYDYDTGLYEGFNVDPYFGTDGGIGVVLDDNGTAHVVYSGYLIWNNPGDDFYGAAAGGFLIPEANAIFYWNENNAAPEIIGKTVMYDANQDGILGDVFQDENYDALSHSNTVAHPLIGIDQNNDIYVTYKAEVDGHIQADSTTVMSSTNGGVSLTPTTEILSGLTRLYSDVFIVKSADAGASWIGPVNLTNSPTTDDVFPSLPRNIDADGVIPVIYQTDSLTGTLLRQTQTFATLNEQAVVQINVADIKDSNAPVMDSEPYISGIPFVEPFPMAQGCPLNEDILLDGWMYAFDYPEGLVEVTLQGNVDYGYVGSIQTEQLVAYDSNGNASDTLSFQIEILEDIDPPVIVADLDCPDITVVAGSAWEAPEVTVLDNSGCFITEANGLLVVNNSVDPNTVGTYTIDYLAEDFAGNVATPLQITVNVVASDTEGPVITASSNIADVLNAGSNLPNYEFTATDNVDCNDVTIDVQGLDDVMIDIPGDYTITVVATDSNNNSTTETYTVTVADLTGPVISLIGPATVSCQNGVFDATVDPGVNAVDNVTDPDDIVVVADYSLVDCTTPGSYTITYTATDEAGNSTEAEREVSVLTGNGIENYLQNLVNVYPNPTNGLININLTDLVAQKVEIYNLAGELVIASNEVQTNNIVFDLSNKAEGLYMVTITTEEGTVTKKVTLK